MTNENERLTASLAERIEFQPSKAEIEMHNATVEPTYTSALDWVKAHPYKATALGGLAVLSLGSKKSRKLLKYAALTGVLPIVLSQLGIKNKP